MTIEISDPFITCPAYETERFRLRQVGLEDTEDLLACYSDPEAGLPGHRTGSGRCGRMGINRRSRMARPAIATIT